MNDVVRYLKRDLNEAGDKIIDLKIRNETLVRENRQLLESLQEAKRDFRAMQDRRDYLKGRLEQEKEVARELREQSKQDVAWLVLAKATIERLTQELTILRGIRY